jgi:hypothetical protein
MNCMHTTRRQQCDYAAQKQSLLATAVIVLGSVLLEQYKALKDHISVAQ